MLNKVRLIPYSIESATFNMSADHYFLNNLKTPILRFYGWKNPTLSFGKSQKKIKDLNWSFCQDNNISLVRRPSGGKTVFHHQELTYSIFFPTNIITGGIVDSYRKISLSLINGLNIDSLSMQKEKRRLPDSSNCFLELSSWEINFKGKKLIGSAQARIKNNVLQHGSILLKLDPYFWDNIWIKKKYSSYLDRITSFYEIFNKDYTPNHIAEKIKHPLLNLLGENYEISPITPKERTSINLLKTSFEFDYYKTTTN